MEDQTVLAFEHGRRACLKRSAIFLQSSLILSCLSAAGTGIVKSKSIVSSIGPPWRPQSRTPRPPRLVVLMYSQFPPTRACDSSYSRPTSEFAAHLKVRRTHFAEFKLR